MKILDKIKEWRKYFRKESLRKRMTKLNPNPYEYRKWEHHGWGDSIQIRGINKNGTFRIVGWLGRRPHNGDRLIYDVESGRRAVGYIVDVDYCSDPRDMFFANVIPFEYYNG